MSAPNLSNLPRNTLSIVLSYLQQYPVGHNEIKKDTRRPHNRDAISLLLTNRRFAFAILPLFRLPKQLCKVHQFEVKNDSSESITGLLVEKYRFIMLPIQDPRTLLDRLNTRRLRRRFVYIKQQQETPGNPNCYQFGRSLEEMALEEWLISQIRHREGADAIEDKQYRVWPAHLELLRFSDRTIYDDEHTDTTVKKTKFKKLFRLCGRKLKDVSQADEWLPRCNPFATGITLLSSYPRSGNTLMRTLLERITSSVTGSDTRPDRSLSIKLALEHDLVGEGLTGKDDALNPTQIANLSLAQKRKLHQTANDPLVNIVKTHFPERKGWRQVTAKRVILLVRNPYDAIDSYWNLCCTNTHTSSLEESVYTKYATKFEALAKHEIKVWCDFHYYWFDVCVKEGIPLLVVRYEDLILNTDKEMQRVLSFLSESENNELGEFWKWRIEHCTEKASKSKGTAAGKASGTASLGSYRPRSSNGGLTSIGKSLSKHRYSENVLCHINDVAASLELERKMRMSTNQSDQNHMTLLQRFGYDIVNQQFPSNFAQPIPPVMMLRTRKRHGSIQINTTAEIRSKDDPFGRAMTNWRRGETNGDRDPFPIMTR